MILLSDGVHNSGLVSPEEATEYAKIHDVQIHTIGLGSVEPVFLRDDIYGEPQYAELDEETLVIQLHNKPMVNITNHLMNKH